jgi:hypothetical protein
MPNVHQIEVGREVYTLNTAKAPIYDAARYLLDNNLASPDDMIEVLARRRAVHVWRGR